MYNIWASYSGFFKWNEKEEISKLFSMQWFSRIGILFWIKINTCTQLISFCMIWNGARWWGDISFLLGQCIQWNIVIYIRFLSLLFDGYTSKKKSFRIFISVWELCMLDCTWILISSLCIIMVEYLSIDVCNVSYIFMVYV